MRLMTSPVAMPVQEGAIAVSITRKEDLTTAEGPEEFFTGKATITGQFQRPEPSRVGGAIVHFEPGARTAWHTHPAGQTLYILSGVGRVQSLGGPVRDVRAGDVIWFSPGEKHWPGAGPTTTMSHMAITEVSDGKFVAWMEKVVDEQYK